MKIKNKFKILKIDNVKTEFKKVKRQRTLKIN